MSAQALLDGMAIFAVYLGSVAVCGRALARRWFGDQPRDVQVLIASVFGFALLTVPAELIGTVGGFKRYPLLIVYLVIGAIGVLLTRRTPAQSPPPGRANQGRAVVLEAAAAAALAVTAGAWYVQTHASYAMGTQGYDSLSYHLPIAVDFFKTGHTGAIPYVEWFLPNNLFPASSELVNGLGMTATNHDVLSPFISLLWLGQILLAAGVAFKNRNQRLLSLIVACVVVLMPAFYISEAGTALADLASAAFVFTGLALFRRLPNDRLSLLVVGLAMGLGISCKLTAVVPAVILIVVALLTPSNRNRLSATVAYVGGAFIGTGLWLIRDWVDIGNPLPELNLHIFPKPRNLFREPIYGHPNHSLYEPRSIAYYLEHLASLSAIRAAMKGGFGPLWWELFIVAAIVLIVGVIRLRDSDRTITIVGLVSAIGYVLTPESAPSVLGKPDLLSVVIETKILLPVLLATGLTLTALATKRSDPKPASIAALALLALGGVDLTNGGIFPTGEIQNWVFSTSGYVVVSLGFFVILIALATTRFFSRMQVGQIRVATGVGLVVAAAIALLGVTQWSQHRYENLDLARDPRVLSALTTAQRDEPLRIGVQGELQPYVFYGEQLKDDVNVLGHRGKHGEFDAPQSCRAFLKNIGTSNDDVVILQEYAQNSVPPLNNWLQRDPTADHIRLPGGGRFDIATGGRVVYVLTAKPSLGDCSNSVLGG